VIAINIKKIFRVFILIFFLDYYQKFFKKNIKTIFSKSKKIILFNATEDLKALFFGYSLALEKKFSNYQFIFYCPLFSFYRVNYKKNFFLFLVYFYYKNIILFFRNYKWKKLYSKFGSTFLIFNNWNIVKEIFLLRKAEKILANIKSHNDLKKLRYKSILIGDLVYDTYLRYNNTYQFDLKSPFLAEILAKIIFRYDKFSKILLKFNIHEYYTNQLGYTHHGLLIRFLRKNKRKVFNFMWMSGPYYSKISSYFYPYNFKKYRVIFKKLKNKNQLLAEASKLLKKKFSGDIISQENYMPYSVYKRTSVNYLPKIKGIIFLHCFVDTPISKGKLIFQDHYYWIVETLEFLKNNNLMEGIAIKTHPDSKEASLKCVNDLKNKFPNFIWLDSTVSNADIFRKKPIFGISAAGTVLYELAYHKILPISAGEHPSIAYNFVLSPKNKSEYFQFLTKAINMKIKMTYNFREILEFVYCNYIYDTSESNLLAKKINLKDWDFKTSKVIINFYKALKKIKKC